jgi:DNA-binding response OmpR family regulator
VVDDEPMLLDLVELVLEPEGFEVRTFQDPDRALADYAALQTPPDVVITDYAMAGTNGLDVIRACRKLNPRQKTILVSGTVDEGVYANSDIKPDIFIPKPYDTDTLVATVRSLTGRK